ncbi:hypothetical protein ACGF4C_20400 [Streptomyces sp. NPDC048197]|uniref:hypothetical protein n=1 Tax=Streptomyces sp. NPDC048197 TaxID=3365511 RepID=UPI003720E4C8
MSQTTGPRDAVSTNTRSTVLALPYGPLVDSMAKEARVHGVPEVVLAAAQTVGEATGPLPTPLSAATELTESGDRFFRAGHGALPVLDVEGCSSGTLTARSVAQVLAERPTHQSSLRALHAPVAA